MGYSAQQLRDLLKLATSLRNFARTASGPAYTRKLLHAAAEVEARAHFLAEHRGDELLPDPQREIQLHASVDVRI
jgi:hypothetical protein